MEIEVLQTLVGDYEELQKRIIAEKPQMDIAPILKQYDPKQHDIHDSSKRPDKIVTTDQGTSTAPVTRISLSLQKKIVRFAVTFLCGNPINLICNPEEGQQAEFFQMVQKVWDDCKLDYKSKQIATLMMSELEVAELWYAEKADPSYWMGTPYEGAALRLRMKLIGRKFGDTLYPVYNAAGDMVAFGRAYLVKADDKNVEHFDVYTDTRTFFGIKEDQGWVVQAVANPIGKIPVIYYSQEAPEWSDVQEAIDRLEVVQSNLGDTNDYFGSPLITVKGKIEGFSKKGDQGKVLELKGDAEVNYLTWDHSPESTRLEYDKLRAAIHELTDTPDIDFEKIKGLGTLSGVALKMMFMGAHMKASEHEETFGECVQRRINFIKAALGKINIVFEPATILNIKPRFEYYLPKNDVEKVDTLVSATAGGILSKKTATALKPLVDNPTVEWDNIQQEASDGLNEQFG